jgi:hypothetical protein
MDEAIYSLAERQHGVVSHAQLRRLGLTPEAIDHRRERGRLRPLYRGVYAAGHRQLRPQGAWLAAVLAYGPGARLGATTALTAWGLRDSPSALIDVVVPTSAGVSTRPGTRLLRRANLLPEECTELDGIPITTVARTLLDAAPLIARHALRRATEQAFRLHGLTVADLRRLVADHRGCSGIPALRALADEFDAYGVTFTRSELEARALELLARFGLPRPEVNHRDGGREIDLRWPEHGLVVELDGWRHHKGRERFVADRARARHHVLRGERFLAYTHDDLARRPHRVAAEIARILSS